MGAWPSHRLGSDDQNPCGIKTRPEEEGTDEQVQQCCTEKKKEVCVLSPFFFRRSPCLLHDHVFSFASLLIHQIAALDVPESAACLELRHLGHNALHHSLQCARCTTNAAAQCS